VTAARAAATAARHFALIDSGDISGMAHLFTRDAVYLRPGYPPFRGREEIARFYATLRPIRSGEHELESVVADGSQLAVRGAFSGVLHSGESIELRFSDFFTVDQDGRFTRRETFFFAPLV
jgi:ketosteroid isomerase-like protein